jgi:hypothetical protein
VRAGELDIRRHSHWPTSLASATHQAVEASFLPWIGADSRGFVMLSGKSAGIGPNPRQKIIEFSP